MKCPADETEIICHINQAGNSMRQWSVESEAFHDKRSIALFFFTKTLHLPRRVRVKQKVLIVCGPSSRRGVPLHFFHLHWHVSWCYRCSKLV